MPNPVADVLRRAADRVAQGWCQHDFAEDANGIKTGPCEANARRWCARGAIYAETNMHDAEAHDVLSDYLGRGVSGWNDEPERTQADVVAALRAAADAAEGRAEK